MQFTISLHRSCNRRAILRKMKRANNGSGSTALLLRFLAFFVFSQFTDRILALDYLDNKNLEKRLHTAESTGKFVRIKKIAETFKRNPVWMVELGNGSDEERKHRPAVLVVAGIEGNDLAGSSSTIFWIESLLKNAATDPHISRMLDSTTLYVFPRLNPDAAETFFAKPKWETAVNSNPTDDDHDGLVDEDGPDDLNGDGLITWMRIEDREGEYILDPADSRLLVKADKSKGERGEWRLLTEGRDNDHDDAWNEDGPGGVNLNRNFPYNYRYFSPTAGVNPVSEIESRALADFVVDHPNIGIVFTFGAADNLIQTSKSEPGGKRPPTAIQDSDLPYYREIGKAFRESLGLKKELTGASEPGTFSDWMYFHRGRLSLAARPWSPPLQLELVKPKSEKEKSVGAGQKEKEPADSKPAEKKDEKNSATKSTSEKKPDAKPKTSSENRNEEERSFLKWIDENAPEMFVPWKTFNHAEFSGKKVEIGGFAPFAKTNPPEKFLEEWANKHSKFLTDLADKLPRIGIRRAEAKHLGESIFEVVVQIENTGYLPTALAQGVTTREILPTRVTFEIEKENILAGVKTSMLGPIDGSGGMKEIRCTLRAKGKEKLGLEVISALGGTVKTTIDLKKE